MIEPTYRRDQLWNPPRRSRMPLIVFAGGILGAALALSRVGIELASVWNLDGTREEQAARIVSRVVGNALPAWRAQHAGCPHRLSELMPGIAVDPWGHAFHFTCDPRLVPGHHFAVVSAGEDGAFGTADDIAAHD